MTKWNKESITQLLLTNDVAVGRALVVLYKRQTEAEKAIEETRNNNGVGFTPADGHIGTSMAKFYLARNFLTPKQLAYWRKPNAKGTPRLAKYWSQLISAIPERSA